MNAIILGVGRYHRIGSHHQVVQHLLRRRFANPDRLDDRRIDYLLPGQRLQAWQHLLLPHPEHLPGHTWHRHDVAGIVFTGRYEPARRRTYRVRQYLGRRNHPRLFGVSFRHRLAPSSEERLQVTEQVRIDPGRLDQHRRDRLARHVVVGRPNPARADHDIGQGHRVADRVRKLFEIVAHVCDVDQVNPGAGQFLG